jgi:hypothetical protein
VSRRLLFIQPSAELLLLLRLPQAGIRST